jgi:hypothetical protein
MDFRIRVMVKRILWKCSNPLDKHEKVTQTIQLAGIMMYGFKTE